LNSLLALVIAHRAQTLAVLLIVLIVTAVAAAVRRPEEDPEFAWLGRAVPIRPKRAFLNVMTLCDRKPGVWFNVRNYAVAVRAIRNPRRVFPRLRYEIRPAPWSPRTRRHGSAGKNVS